MQGISTYLPQIGLVVYGSKTADNNYVESFNFDDKGYPVNAHPLTDDEALSIARALVTGNNQRAFLNPSKLLSPNVLHFETTEGYVMWFTPSGKRDIRYIQSLKIKSGPVKVPALLWKATRDQLYVFALNSDERPTDRSKLFKAPFFNISTSGLVCMGTVDIRIAEDDSIEKFMSNWEKYFFESNFSHAGDSRVTKSNFFTLWKRLHKSAEAFPTDELVESTITIKKLIQ